MPEPLGIHAPPPFFVAGNRSGSVGEETVVAFARWCGADTWLSRPLPTDRPGVILTADGPRLQAPGLAPVLWHSGFAPFRMRRGPEETLVAVLRLALDETVLDCTLGLGHDALVLANAGARVTAVERLGPVLLHAAVGLHRSWPAQTRRITFRRDDHAALLERAPTRAFDHVFLDPMFPADRAGPGPILAPLRAIASGGRPTPALLADARRVARRSVVLRLASGEAAPAGWDVEGSRRVRYAVWRTPDACATPSR